MIKYSTQSSTGTEGRAVVQAVSRRFRTVEARLRSRPVYVRCVVGKVTLGQDVVPVIIRRTSGQSLSDVGEHQTGETFTFVCSLQGLRTETAFHEWRLQAEGCMPNRPPNLPTTSSPSVLYSVLFLHSSRCLNPRLLIVYS